VSHNSIQFSNIMFDVLKIKIRLMADKGKPVEV